VQCGLNVLGRELRIACDDLGRCVTIRDAADDDADGNARADNARLTVMDGRIGEYSGLPVCWVCHPAISLWCLGLMNVDKW